MGVHCLSEIEIPYIEPLFIGEKYEVCYRGLNYEGKTILEIGADVGSTASYFLKNGAKKVISVEGDERYFKKLKENSEGLGSEPIFLTVDTKEKLETLINSYKPDILHMDCEGCEKVLSTIERGVLEQIPEYEIEVHWSKELLWNLVEKFLDLNYEVSCFLYVIQPGSPAWVLTAKKLSLGQQTGNLPTRW